MGSVHLSGEDFFESLSEIVGFKSGLALGREDLIRLLSKDDRFEEFLTIDDEAYLRLNSVEYEEIVEHLLYRVGVLESSHNIPSAVALHHKYKHDKRLHGIAMEIVSTFTDFLNSVLDRPEVEETKLIDPTPFFDQVMEKYGAEGLEIAIQQVELFHADLVRSPWSQMIRREWRDTVELRDLFESERLDTLYGTFVDQQYIDYLHRNFDDIDRINWRKFEGLTGEYFDRAGFHVSMGPGRNDDGVDVRVWPAENDTHLPPAIIVQCKRQRKAVEKVVVKALYADVLQERADSGLIVTSSVLSPGARKICEARKYPILEADRSAVRQWISELRKPGAGIVI